MNILVTGVAGFIGSNVICYLVTQHPEYKFVGIDKLSYCSSVMNFMEIKTMTNFTFVKADICDLDFMDHVFTEYHIDVVMHFAAYTHVDHSFGNSLIFTHNNVIGTHVLLEVSKKHKITKFIHVSTDEIYGNSHEQSDETSIADPTNPYAATKAAAEHLVKSYYHSFKLPVIITRGNNCYGIKQYPEKVIPKFILRLLRGLPCIIQGSGKQLRSFLHVDDVARAFDIILHKGVIGEVYNIGCPDEHSIIGLAKDLVDLLVDDLTEIDKYIIYGKDRDFNDQRYYISNSKLVALGWKPEVGFVDGLRQTIDWYKANGASFWFSDADELLAILNK